MMKNFPIQDDSEGWLILESVLKLILSFSKFQILIQFIGQSSSRGIFVLEILRIFLLEELKIFLVQFKELLSSL